MDKLDITEAGDEDGDLFPMDQSNEIFPEEYHLAAKCSVGLDKTYVLQLDFRQNSNLAAGLSNNTVSIFDPSSLLKKVTFKAHSQKLTGVKLSPQNESLLYTSSFDQSIKLWDLRCSSTQKAVLSFIETNQGRKGKPLTSFDVNCSDMFLAAGTEEVSQDSFLLFWDVRNANLLGGYWNTFGGDVTDVKFHPDKPDMLATGGADSIVNVFDISCSSEDDALVTSTVIESCVSNLTWYARKSRSNYLAVTTDDNQLSFWCTDDPGPETNLSREDLSLGLRRKLQEWSYVVNTHFDSANEQVFVLGGSSCPNHPSLRVLLFKRHKLKPFANLVDKSVRNSVVRASVFDSSTKSFFTGSEEGFICLWNQGKAEISSQSSGGKSISSLKNKPTVQPY